MTDRIAARVERRDSRLDAVIPGTLWCETLADLTAREGRHWLEGPAWDRRGRCLLFSDVKANAIYRWTAGDGVRLLMHPSGYSGATPFPGEEPGSNGLAFDREGRLLICEHGDRRIRRREADGSLTVLADRYQGRRLNSPNDLVVADNGDIYFTDPPYGLPLRFDDPGRELPFCGVYRLSAGGALSLIIDHLKAPNGIGLSPDHRTLYVGDGDPERSGWLAYRLGTDGRAGDERLLLDVTQVPGYGGPDGLDVDRLGTIFATGREAIFVIAADGTHLGTIAMGSIITNVAWGEDGTTLFATTENRLYRLEGCISGAAW